MTPFDVPYLFMIVCVFAFGCTVGSFLNVCVYRIPQHRRLKDQLKGLWSPPSTCPGCQTQISPRDNIPVIGWCLLGGRCRTCQGRISIRYPLVELFNGLLFVLVYWLEVPSGFLDGIRDSGAYSPVGPQLITGWSDTAVLHWRYLFHIVMIESLIVASLIDIDLKIIPDGSTVPAMVIGFVMAAGVGQVYLVPVWFQDPRAAQAWDLIWPGMGQYFEVESQVPAWILAHPHFHGFVCSAVGFLVGGGMVWGVRLIGHWVLRREAMGFGDVILMAMIGTFLGWQPTIAAFFIAPAIALVVVAACWIVKRPREIPYGPYLSVAALMTAVAWRHMGGYLEEIFQQGPLVPLMGVIMFAMLFLTLHVMQLLKRLMGIPLYPEVEWEERWTSADQLAFFAGETVDDQQGQWRQARWPGVDAGRGQLEEETWRHGGQSDQGLRWNESGSLNEP